MSVSPALPILRRSLASLGAAAARFARRDHGSSMAQYALLLAVIGLIALAGAKLLGATLGYGATVAASRIANP